MEDDNDNGKLRESDRPAGQEEVGEHGIFVPPNM